MQRVRKATQRVHRLIVDISARKKKNLITRLSSAFAKQLVSVATDFYIRFLILLYAPLFFKSGLKPYLFFLIIYSIRT